MQTSKLNEVIDIISGGTPKTNIPEYWNGNINWLSVVDFSNKNKYVEASEKTITEKGLKNSSTKLLNKNDIIISARGTVGTMAILKKPMAFNQSCFGLRAKPQFLNQDFLFYFLKNYMKNIKAKTQGSIFETINLLTFDMLDITYPDYKIQEKISKLLSKIDDKIELNNKINSELENMAKTIYDYWFLQFEFPNEEGKPYKSSGGKMVWNEELKKEIPDGWEVKYIKDYVEIFTGKEDANHSTINGRYPFFTCSNDILYCDDYKFEGKSILIAGNGDFNVKYYDGKFNAYQRTYVLISKKEEIVGLLYQSTIRTIEKFKITSNGSIVKFITKGAVENILILDSKGQVNISIFNELLNKIEKNKKENQELISVRDYLLPLLMNGQVGFKE